MVSNGINCWFARISDRSDMQSPSFTRAMQIDVPPELSAAGLSYNTRYHDDGTMTVRGALSTAGKPRRYSQIPVFCGGVAGVGWPSFSNHNIPNPIMSRKLAIIIRLLV